MQYREEDHQEFEAALVKSLMTAAEKTCFAHMGKEIKEVLYCGSSYSFEDTIKELVGDALYQFGKDNINARTATMAEIYNGDAK